MGITWSRYDSTVATCPRSALFSSSSPAFFAFSSAMDDTLSHLRSPPSHLRDEPAAKLVEEVLEGTAAMGLTLERGDAIRLLRGHHNHVSDAIAAAFG